MEQENPQVQSEVPSEEYYSTLAGSVNSWQMFNIKHFSKVIAKL
jgi:hypothetical protein